MSALEFRMSFIPGLLFFAVSCSGPQMVSAPKNEAPPAVEKKQSVAERITVPEAQPDEGVFDDEQHLLKTDLSQWKLIANENSVQTYEKIKRNAGLVAFRGEIMIPAPLKKIATILVTDSLQKDWVDSFVSTKTVSEKSDLEHVEYNQTKVPWPFQNRDFVFRVTAKVNVQPPTMLIMMKSLEDPAAPPIDGVVRGEIVHSYYYLKEMPGTQGTKMVVEMEVDPRGAIPLWLVNLSQKGWPQNTLLAVKKLSLRDDIPVSAQLEKYFEVKEPVAVKPTGKKFALKNKKGKK